MPKPKGGNLISRAEAARRRRCSRAAVTLACKGALADACVGSRIDADHAAYRFWLAAADRSPTASLTQAGAKPAAPTDIGLEFRRATLAKRRAEVQALELKLARERGGLISRELVRSHVFGHLERLHQRLLNDLLVSAATRITATSTREERIAILRELVGTELGAAKEAVIRSLRAITAEAPADAVEERPPPHVSGEHEDTADPRRHGRNAANLSVRRGTRRVQE